MVVTASLARGAVRAAVEKNSETYADLRVRIRRTGFEPPSTLRRFDEWLRRHTAVHERDALLIVRGMTGRRSAAYTAFHPHFVSHDRGWDLTIFRVHVAVTPGKLTNVESDPLPLTISGHALERMFQRTNEISWPVVRDYLATAATFANALREGYVAAQCRQCAILAGRGLLVGQLIDGHLELRTFLPETNLGTRWKGLHDGLTAFEEEHREIIQGSALVPDPEVAERFQRFLRAGSFGWLFKPYVAGEDPLEDAWRSREQ